MTPLALALLACCWAVILVIDIPESRRREAVWMLAVATPSIAVAGALLR